MRAERALIAQLAAKLSPAKVTVVAAEFKPWASVTFSGARHMLTLLVEGPNAILTADKLARTICCEEFSIPGHLVADILVVNCNNDVESIRLDIEALTVVDD